MKRLLTWLWGSAFRSQPRERVVIAPPPVPSAPSASDDQTAYAAAVSLFIFASEVTWARFNALLLANSILIVVIVTALTSDRDLGWVAAALSGVGIVLSVVWYGINQRSHAYQKFYARHAEELETRLVDIRIFKDGRRFSQGHGVDLYGDTEPFRVGAVARHVKVGLGARAVIFLFCATYVLFVLITVFSNGDDDDSPTSTPGASDTRGITIESNEPAGDDTAGTAIAAP